MTFPMAAPPFDALCPGNDQVALSGPLGADARRMICQAPTLRTSSYATKGPHNYKVRLCRPRFSHTTPTKVFRCGSQANGCLLTELPRTPLRRSSQNSFSTHFGECPKGEVRGADVVLRSSLANRFR